MRRCLISIATMSLLTMIMLTPVFAHTVTVISGEPVLTAPSLQIKTDNGFEAPVLGETHEDEILYNIPSDGSDPVPLREVPTLYIGEDLPVAIDESISAEYTTRGLVYPGSPKPITVGDWIKGDHSKLKIKILKNGMSQVKMKIKSLLPNSLYGVWQFNLAGGPLPGPFGGIPNVFVTDAKGNATMKRTLPFNANEVIDNLLVIYHSDHRIYGGTPTLTPGGNDVHVQLKFDVKATQ